MNYTWTIERQPPRVTETCQLQISWDDSAGHGTRAPKDDDWPHIVKLVPVQYLPRTLPDPVSVVAPGIPAFFDAFDRYRAVSYCDEIDVGNTRIETLVRERDAMSREVEYTKKARDAAIDCGEDKVCGTTGQQYQKCLRAMFHREAKRAEQAVDLMRAGARSTQELAEQTRRADENYDRGIAHVVSEHEQRAKMAKLETFVADVRTTLDVGEPDHCRDCAFFGAADKCTMWHHAPVASNIACGDFTRASPTPAPECRVCDGCVRAMKYDDGELPELCEECTRLGAGGVRDNYTPRETPARDGSTQIAPHPAVVMAREALAAEQAPARECGTCCDDCECLCKGEDITGKCVAFVPRSTSVQGGGDNSLMMTVEHKPMPNPTEMMLEGDPLFDAIWQTIKRWDVNVPDYYLGHCSATGSHVCLIYDAIKHVQKTPPLPADVQRVVEAARKYAELKMSGQSTWNVQEDLCAAVLALLTPGEQRSVMAHVASVGIGSITVPIVDADESWVGREVTVSWKEQAK